MAPHVPKENVSRPGKAQLATIVKKKKEEVPPTNKKIKKNKIKPIVRVGEAVPVEDDGVSLDVVEKLGRGAFGEVFKVKYENYDRFLAMKVVRVETSWQKQMADEEVDILLELSDHTLNEFILHSFFSFSLNRNGQMAKCFVSELLDKPMSDMLDEARGDPLCAVVVKAVGHQVLSALDCLHEIGITHCDVKPDNVMIVDMKNMPLRVKLIDFGLAKHTRTLPQGYKIQNIEYKCPEVLFGLPLSEKLDIWSAAVMFCEIYTGLDLFPAKYKPELARYIENYVGLPEEVVAGSVTSKFMVLEEGRQTVMSYAETQLGGLLDVKEDQREIPSLDKVGEFGHNYLYRDGVTEEDRRFVDVLEKMLRPNAADRYGAKEALQSPFFSSFDGNYDP